MLFFCDSVDVVLWEEGRQGWEGGAALVEGEEEVEEGDGE